MENSTDYLYETVVRFFNETENQYRKILDAKDSGARIEDSVMAGMKCTYEDLHGAIILYERYGDTSGLKTIVDRYIDKKEEKN